MKKNIAFTTFLTILLSFIFSIPQAHAAQDYSGGLLDGVTMILGEKTYAPGIPPYDAVKTATDNKETTSAEMNWDRTYYESLWYNFPAPVTLRNYRLLATPSQTYEIKYKLSNNSTGTITTKADTSGILSGFSELVNVVRIEVFHAYTGAYSLIYEFNVYGEVTPIPPPAIPKGLSGLSGDSQVTLNWTANSESDLKGYNVYKDGSKVNVSPITGTSFNVNGLTNGTAYAFQITSFNANSESNKSTAVNLTPLSTTPPTQPKDLYGTAGNEQVILHWSANGESDMKGYNIYQGTTKLNGSPIIGTNFIVSSGLTNGISYSYTITAVNTSNLESVKSATVNVIPTNVTPPAIPKGLSGLSGDSQVTLNWTANSESDLLGYNIYQGTTKINSSPITGTTYNVMDLTNAITYSFTISAINTSNSESAKSGAINVTPLNTIPPAIPTGLAATAGNTQIFLNWTANTEPDLKGYNVYYNATKLNGSPITGKKYTVSSLTNGTSYSFTIKAVNTSGYESNNSAAAAAIPVPPPAIPEGLTATPADSKVTLRWTANTETNLKGYFIYQDGVKLNSTPYRVTSFDVASGLTNGVTYSFAIQSIDDGGYQSAISAAVTATPRDTTPPAIPTGVKGSGVTNAAKLSWDPNTESDLQGYNIYQGSTKLNGSPITATNYTVSSLTNGSTYDFSITAIDLLGNESLKSALISVTPVNVPTPTGLKAKPTTTEVTLSWDPPAQPTTYIIYRDGVQVATAATPTYIDTNVTSGKHYSYDVVAVDPQNQQSAKTNVMTYFSKNSTDYQTNKLVFSPSDLIKVTQDFLVHYAGFILLAAILIFSKPLTKLAIKIIKFLKIRFDDEDPDLTKDKVKRPERIKIERVKTERVNEVKPTGKGFNWAVFFGVEKPAKRQRKGRSKSSSLKQKAITELRIKEKALKAEIREKDRLLKKEIREKERIREKSAKLYNDKMHEHVMKRRREADGKPEPAATKRRTNRPNFASTPRPKRS